MDVCDAGEDADFAVPASTTCLAPLICTASSPVEAGTLTGCNPDSTAAVAAAWQHRCSAAPRSAGEASTHAAWASSATALPAVPPAALVVPTLGLPLCTAAPSPASPAEHSPGLSYTLGQLHLRSQATPPGTQPQSPHQLPAPHPHAQQHSLLRLALARQQQLAALGEPRGAGSSLQARPPLSPCFPASLGHPQPTTSLELESCLHAASMPLAMSAAAACPPTSRPTWAVPGNASAVSSATLSGAGLAVDDAARHFTPTGVAPRSAGTERSWLSNPAHCAPTLSVMPSASSPL